MVTKPIQCHSKQLTPWQGAYLLHRSRIVNSIRTINNWYQISLGSVPQPFPDQERTELPSCLFLSPFSCPSHFTSHESTAHVNDILTQRDINYSMEFTFMLEFRPFQNPFSLSLPPLPSPASQPASRNYSETDQRLREGDSAVTWRSISDLFHIQPSKLPDPWHTSSIMCSEKIREDTKSPRNHFWWLRYQFNVFIRSSE